MARPGDRAERARRAFGPHARATRALRLYRSRYAGWAAWHVLLSSSGRLLARLSAAQRAPLARRRRTRGLNRKRAIDALKHTQRTQNAHKPRDTLRTPIGANLKASVQRQKTRT